MKKGIILVLTVVVVLAGSVSAGDYSGGGNGSAEQPYRISTAADMNNIEALTAAGPAQKPTHIKFPRRPI